MAWKFSLSIEFGTDAAAAKKVAEQFADFAIPEAPDGVTPRQFVDAEGHNWLSLVPVDVDPGDEGQHARALTLAMYGHMKNGPPYRYALAGVEVDEFRLWSELVTDGEAGTLMMRGLILDRGVHLEVGSPEGFETFDDLRVWRPLAGLGELAPT